MRQAAALILSMLVSACALVSTQQARSCTEPGGCARGLYQYTPLPPTAQTAQARNAALGFPDQLPPQPPFIGWLWLKYQHQFQLTPGERSRMGVPFISG
jgi:hypothetical protein